MRQLDVRRAQVLIEAVVAEVADQTASEIGVQWQMPFKQNSDGSIRDSVIGGTNFTGTSPGNNIIQAAQNPLGVGNGFNLGYINGTITVGRNTIFQLGALVTALQGDGKSNILSTPSVLTLDNQEAEIKVAQEVPFLTGQYTTNALGSQTTTTVGGSTTTGVTNPFQTIERKDVGLVLKVTPHINEGDSVRIDIHQEVSNLLPPVQGAVDLVTNKREVTTSVLVADNSLLVLGGLLDNQLKDNVQKVPVLGDIPLLGNLFRYRTNDRTKSDLMVFLHPRILRDAATEASVSSEKYNFMRTEQLQMREEALADHAVRRSVRCCRTCTISSQARRSTASPTSRIRSRCASHERSRAPVAPGVRLRAPPRRRADRLARRSRRDRVPRRRARRDPRRAAPPSRRAAALHDNAGERVRASAARSLRAGRRCARDGVRSRRAPRSARRSPTNCPNPKTCSKARTTRRSSA